MDSLSEPIPEIWGATGTFVESNIDLQVSNVPCWVDPPAPKVTEK